MNRKPSPRWASESPVFATDLIEGDAQIVGSVGGDSRAVEGVQAQIEREKLRAKVRTAISGIDDTSLTGLVSDIEGANEGYVNAFNSYLDTGRKLVAINNRLGRQYAALFRAGIFHFSEAQASKMRAIATKIDTGMIPADLVSKLPPNLAGTYALTTLPQDRMADTIRDMVERNILPSASIKEIEREVKRIKDGDSEKSELELLKEKLEQKRQARTILEREISDLEQKMQSLENPKQALSAVLEPDDTA